MTKHKIIVGITGASGAIYGKLLLERLQEFHDQIESIGVIFSENAISVWKYELNENPDAVGAKHLNGMGAELKVYRSDDFFAPMASGSAGYNVMIICPCTMGTLGRISAGISNDLITRAADVMLKERKKLILVPRETPYNLIHLCNMKLLTGAGAIICPATPSFYSKPANIEELIMTVVDRILNIAGFEIPGFRWGEN
ncbi:MAG: UbiX family flavin prenyltransferase [Bacteroidetes bacterium]|nr:UbiX family flavin prenyltransferase [Bacteroidota bacterium]